MEQADVLLHESNSQLLGSTEASSIVDTARWGGNIFGTTPVQTVNVVRKWEESVGADGDLAQFLKPWFSLFGRECGGDFFKVGFEVWALNAGFGHGARAEEVDCVARGC